MPVEFENVWSVAGMPAQLEPAKAAPKQTASLTTALPVPEKLPVVDRCSLVMRALGADTVY